MLIKSSFIFACLISFSILFLQNQDISNSVIDPPGEKPSDWFYLQRAYPFLDINYNAIKNAWIQAEELKNNFKKRNNYNAWISAGPINIGGRITDIEIHPGTASIIYAGAASGGVFKSIDSGNNWFPLFDQQISLSIGDIALAPGNPDIIYVGTGEANCGGGSLAYEGMGVFKSTDGGNNWIHLGLEETRNIGRIVVDPTDSQRVYVAAMGKLFAGNPERGLYRTTDGGTSWENVLFVSDTTGCIDVVMNPLSPDTIYAAMWERIRQPWGRKYGGITSAIYRSYDGGNSWQVLSNGLPVNIGNIGRIGLAICKSEPQILYAIYADEIGYFNGVYKTTDGGDSWIRTNDGTLGSLFSSYGWWFGNIRVAPNNPDIVFAMGMDVYKSTNGGQNWSHSSGSMHVDQHGLDIDPINSDFVVAGNDGGIYISQNGGNSWSKVNSLPITQFYTCEVNQQNINHLYGGTQDNGTNRTLTGSSNDWQMILGADGFYVLVDPVDSQFVYAEYQWGGFFRSTDGGNWFDYAKSGISVSDRNNWNTPVVFDPSNTRVMYYGTNKLYKSMDRAESWNVISPDLTNGPGINIPFGTITTIAVASTDSNYIYVGTDDGNVWVTMDGGTNWVSISASLPQRWVTRVAVDPYDELTAYVTFSGYRWDEYIAHIYRTTDAGISWTDISSNLPEAPLTDVIIDPVSNSTLYVSSDVGVFITDNLGISWSVLGDSLPNSPIMDLVLHNNTRTLIAATYGRSMYKYNLDSTTPVAFEEYQPGGFQLFQNYPNPFNPNTKIKYSLSSNLPYGKGVVKREMSNVSLKVYDVLGNEIATLVDEEKPAGEYEIEFSATGGSASGGNAYTLPSGIYFYQLRAGDFVETKKMILLR